MLPTNTTFDVYRGYAPATPYNPPQRPAVLAGLQGYLHQHMRNGRFGYYPSGEQAPLYWTTVLDVPIGTDARDAYASQLNSDTIQNGDTVMVYDYPLPGTCCAFVVSFVQRRNRGTSADLLRLYLDRAQPQWIKGCPDPRATGGGGGGGGTVQVPCCPTGINATLYVTLVNVSNLASIAGTYTLTYDASKQLWVWNGTTGGVTTGQLLLGCGPPYNSIQDFGLNISDGTNSRSFTTPPSGSCSPFSLSFGQTQLTFGTTTGIMTATVSP